MMGWLPAGTAGMPAHLPRAERGKMTTAKHVAGGQSGPEDDRRCSASSPRRCAGCGGAI